MARSPRRQRVIEASIDRLEELRALQARSEALAARRLSRIDVFATLGFAPNCSHQLSAVREQLTEREIAESDVAAEALAYLRESDRAAEDGIAVPPRCGRCPQERFLDLPHENLDVLYGGAGGGGKSASLLALALRACVRFPGIQVFWFRNSFPELEQSVLRMLARYGYASALGATYNGSTHELRFPGAPGSVLTFAHAKNLKEASALSSAEINLLILDERTTIDPAVVNFLYTRVRSGVPGVPCLGIRSASNPGFVGHGVVKAGWVEATGYGAREIIDGAGRRRIFIPARVSDNPFVLDYAETLRGIDDPELQRRILDGDWSVMPDGAFGDFRRDHIVVPAMDLPPSWPRYGGLDYGWTAPSVYLVAARDADGRMWVYREIAMRQTPEMEQARRVMAAEDVPVIIRAADPAMWGQTGSALPPSSQFAIAGCPLRKADNDRFTGKQRVHTYLALGPACAYHRELGRDRCSMLHVIDTAAPDLIRTMEDLPRDPNRPEDVDTNAEDHFYDALRYLLMAVGAIASTVFDDDDPPPDYVQRGPAAWRPDDLAIPAGAVSAGYAGAAPTPGDFWSQT